MPLMPGLPGGMPGGMPGGVPGAPGGLPQAPPQGGALPDAAMSALNDVLPATKNTQVTMQRVDEALALAHKLIITVIPQVTNVNPTVTKDLHQIAQRVLEVRNNVMKETPVGPPPEMLMDMMAGGTPGPGGASGGLL